LFRQSVGRSSPIHGRAQPHGNRNFILLEDEF
jgi:hypothetical protein